MQFPYTLLVSSDFLFFHDSIVVGASSKGQGQLQAHRQLQGFFLLAWSPVAGKFPHGHTQGSGDQCWESARNSGYAMEYHMQSASRKEVCEDTGGTLILCHLKHTCNILSNKKQKTYWQWCFCILRDHL